MKNLTYACFLETFGQDTCSAEADGDLRSGRVLGQETTHPFHGGHRRHDQDGGDLRSGCVLGQETGTIIFVSVRAQPHDQKCNRGDWVGFHPLFRGGRCNRGVVPLPIRFTARKDGDLRSGCVLGRETTHPFHGGHRRHDQKHAQAVGSPQRITLV